MSHSIAIDFDRDDGLALATRMAAAMWLLDFPAYVETSRRGAHLWAVLAHDPVPAKVIRMGLRAVLQSLDMPADDPKIELRPGSDHVDDDGLGHALRLPLMPHPKTGRRGEMLDPRSGKPIGKTLAEVLLEFDQAPSARLYEWAEKFKPLPLRPTSLPSKHRLPHEPFPEDESLASDILRELWGVENALPGRTVRCPAHEDKFASLSILRDDKRVICKAGSCILNNDEHGRGTYELRKLAPRGGGE